MRLARESHEYSGMEITDTAFEAAGEHRSPGRFHVSNCIRNGCILSLAFFWKPEYNNSADRGDNEMQTGQIIMELRSAAGLTQAGLADKLYVSRDLISKWETGKRLPSYQMILEMAKLFSVDPERFLPKDSILSAELSQLLPEEYDANGETLKKDLNLFLGTLSARDRRIFIRRCYFFEEYAEIGEEYGLKENHVRTILARTRRKLKKYLKEEYT